MSPQLRRAAGLRPFTLLKRLLSLLVFVCLDECLFPENKEYAVFHPGYQGFE